MKKLALQDLKDFREMQRIPISDAQLEENPSCRRTPPGPDAPEIRYMLDRAAPLAVSFRIVEPRRRCCRCRPRVYKALKKVGQSGSRDHHGDRATFKELLRDKAIGPRLVPIIPDEAARSAWLLVPEPEDLQPQRQL